MSGWVAVTMMMMMMVIPFSTCLLADRNAEKKKRQGGGPFPTCGTRGNKGRHTRDTKRICKKVSDPRSRILPCTVENPSHVPLTTHSVDDSE